MRKVTVYRKKETALTISKILTANFYIQFINTTWKVNYKNLKIFSVSAPSGSSKVTLIYGFLSLFAEYCGHLLYDFCDPCP